MVDFLVEAIGGSAGFGEVEAGVYSQMQRSLFDFTAFVEATRS